jgi:L-ascorbate metabolism protein UlaG (beta-lactamase superfamily)
MTSPEPSSFLGECCEALYTRRRFLKGALAGGALLAGASSVTPGAAATSPRRGSTGRRGSKDPYTSLVPAAAGGPVLERAHQISLRWLGCSCYELVHRGKVYLLDTWFDRGPRMRPLGFTTDDIVRADAIFIGHAHFDHIAESPVIAARTGAMVAGAPISTAYVQSQGIPASQLWTVTGRGGERMEFDGFVVEPILAHHAVGPTSQNRKGETVGVAMGDVYEAALGVFTPEETAESQAIFSRGSFDPLIITEGTIAYLFTFDRGYHMVWVDSGGPITPQLRAVMSRIGRTNLAIASYTVQGIPHLQVPVTMALVDLFRPDVFLPCHHDALIFSTGALPDMATEPLMMAIRDSMHETEGIQPLYRNPVVVNTRTGEYSVA